MASRVTRFVKSLLYMGATLLFLLNAVIYQNGMYKEDGLETSYFSEGRFLFFTAAVLVGVAAYGLQASQMNRTYRMDFLFLLITGSVLLLITVLMTVLYGGMSAPFDESGYTAANVYTVVSTALPLTFWMRGLVLTVGIRDSSATHRRIGAIVCAVAAMLLLTLTVSGKLMHFVRYEPTRYYQDGYEE